MEDRFFHGGLTEVKNCCSQAARQFSSHHMLFEEGYLYVSHSNTDLPGTGLGSLMRIRHHCIQMMPVARPISIYC
ncbi:hypothetical protein Gotur_012967 [Gossypium turneri]